MKRFLAILLVSAMTLCVLMTGVSATDDSAPSIDEKNIVETLFDASVTDYSDWTGNAGYSYELTTIDGVTVLQHCTWTSGSVTFKRSLDIDWSEHEYANIKVVAYVYIDIEGEDSSNICDDGYVTKGKFEIRCVDSAGNTTNRYVADPTDGLVLHTGWNAIELTLDEMPIQSADSASTQETGYTTTNEFCFYLTANAWELSVSLASAYIIDTSYDNTATTDDTTAEDDTTAADDTTEADDTTAADDTTTAASTTSNVEVDLTNATVIDDGNGSWSSDGSGDPNTVASMAFDGDTSTYYDSASGENAYVGVQLAEATAIEGFAIYPRAGYAYRLEGALIQGSTDNETWVTLYTIAADEYTEGEWTVYEITDTTAYTYYRLLTPSTNCNPAEIVLYSTYSTGSTGSTAVSPQTGFAFVGLGVVALASGAAIVVSKKRH
ncbi:MAG: discoidin domain-containing protein [Clostridia bacterium]|nr:discoidin domain-containing protein [Clostridia bacterium]